MINLFFYYKILFLEEENNSIKTDNVDRLKINELLKYFAIETIYIIL